MSIKGALHKYCQAPQPLRYRLIQKALRVNMHDFHAHMTAREIRRKLPQSIYNKFFKFAFVRNPWDWQVSLYFYMLETPNHFQHQVIKAMGSFDEYIAWRVAKDKHLQNEFVTDGEGKLIVDFVGKYEELGSEFRKVCNRIGVEQELAHLNKSSHRDYRAYYNEKTMKLVHDAFEDDIALFGYWF